MVTKTFECDVCNKMHDMEMEMNEKRSGLP